MRLVVVQIVPVVAWKQNKTRLAILLDQSNTRQRARVAKSLAEARNQEFKS
jgi:hypothetical protein